MLRLLIVLQRSSVRARNSLILLPWRRMLLLGLGMRFVFRMLVGSIMKIRFFVILLSILCLPRSVVGLNVLNLFLVLLILLLGLCSLERRFCGIYVRQERRCYMRRRRISRRASRRLFRRTARRTRRRNVRRSSRMRGGIRL